MKRIEYVWLLQARIHEAEVVYNALVAADSQQQWVQLTRLEHLRNTLARFQANPWDV